MSYLVLARKWRPRIFSEIVGQQHVVRALTNALESERLHHAYLFAGTRGVGKTTIARILAKALNCEDGLTAEPCGNCSACREIDEGRFVDLIEVDAASKTKVDDTRELLDNVPFAPAGGRFKVYLIDEVHMLTKHSFNALLKTLEEPPPHVKFLLATTDPQKLPVTVLSRCLQFNLKRLTPTLIRERLQFICAEETIAAEPQALAQIARAADGSLRDALSLLDQAIAFCGGDVLEAGVTEMLGTIDRRHVVQILARLAEGDAAGLMAAVDEIDQQFPDYAHLLDELARVLQRIAVHQVLGERHNDSRDADDDAAGEESADWVSRFAAEDLQLFYQIAITGRRDLSMAPDPRSGVEMTLLRMLAFRPEGVGRAVANRSTKPTAAEQPPVPGAAKSDTSSVATASKASSKGSSWEHPDWAAVVPQLKLRGVEGLLASNCALLGREGNLVRLGLASGAETYLTRPRQEALQRALSEHFGETLKLEISSAADGAETPIQKRAREANDDLNDKREGLESDPNVLALKNMFGATMDPDSVRINDNKQ